MQGSAIAAWMTRMPDPEPLAYAHRGKPYSAETQLTLDTGSLIAERGRSRQVFALDRIERIRLAFTPRNTARLAFTCEVRAADGRSVRFDNLSWKSLIETERLDRDFRTFVLALAARARAANPATRLEAGVTRLRHRLMLVFGAGLVLALIAAAVIAAGKGSALVMLFAIGLAAYLGFWLRDFLIRNRPRSFTPEVPPEGVLPAP
ncbi:MAG: hypothetical protein LDL25_08075 [Hyphomicrobiales bacterium]|nr:hypothetical protein [Hyphomicrobiales bacterium]